MLFLYWKLENTGDYLAISTKHLAYKLFQNGNSLDQTICLKDYMNAIPGCNVPDIERMPDALMRRFKEPYLSWTNFAESWKLGVGYQKNIEKNVFLGHYIPPFISLDKSLRPFEKILHILKQEN